jgi:hypothetical protein
MTRRHVPPELQVLAVAALLLLAPSAHAYLDPSTGSLILSAIVGLLATVGLAIKTWWYKIKALFRRGAPRSGDDGTAGR